MTARFLTLPDDAGKLVGTPWEGLQPPPETTSLLVVEDESGVVVGTWSLAILPHLEGFWVDPGHRSRASVVRALLTYMFRHLQKAGVDTVLTHAPGQHIDDFLTRLGGEPLPGRAFKLSVTGSHPTKK